MVDNNPKIVVLEKYKSYFCVKKLGFWFIPMIGVKSFAYMKVWTMKIKLYKFNRLHVIGWNELYQMIGFLWKIISIFVQWIIVKVRVTHGLNLNVCPSCLVTNRLNKNDKQFNFTKCWQCVQCHDMMLWFFCWIYIYWFISLEVQSKNSKWLALGFGFR
jgi:hypothetical protein